MKGHFYEIPGVIKLLDRKQNDGFTKEGDNEE
jgi:hypothetical protein